MLRFIKLLEWRSRLKRYQKDGRVVPMLLETFGTVILCRILHVGFTLCDIEIVEDAESERGVETNTVEIEEIILSVNRYSDGVRAQLSRQFPDLAAMGRDMPGPEGEVSDEEILELTEEELRAMFESGDLELPPGMTFEEFLDSLDSEDE